MSVEFVRYNSFLGAIWSECMLRSAKKRGAEGVIHPGFLLFNPYTVFFIWIVAVAGVALLSQAQAGEDRGGRLPHLSGSMCGGPEAHAASIEIALKTQRNGTEITNKKACGGKKCRCCIDGFCSCMKKSQCDTNGGSCKARKPKENDGKTGLYRLTPFRPRSSAVMSYAACTIGG